MGIKTLIRASGLLLAANLAAGALNYFYQLRGAAELAPADYGRLNAWLAYVSLALSAGMIAQFVGNFSRLGQKALRKVGGLSACIGLVGVVLLALSPADGAFWIGVLSVAACFFGFGFYFLLGQLQANTAFLAMGLSLLLLACAKVGWTFTGTTGVERFYVAMPISFAIAFLVTGLAILIWGGKAKHSVGSMKGAGWRRDLMCAAVIAVGTSLMPQLDILNVRLAHTDEVLGLFSRAGLFAKAIFFGAVTLLQVTLPYHVQAQRDPEGAAAHKGIRLFERIGLALCVVGSFVLYWIAPWISSRFLGYDLKPYQLWVLLSCLSLTALYGQLQTIQVLAAFGDWKRAGIRVMLISLSLPLCAWFKPASIPLYLGLAMSYSLGLTIWDFWRLKAPTFPSAQPVSEV